MILKLLSNFWMRLAVVVVVLTIMASGIHKEQLPYAGQALLAVLVGILLGFLLILGSRAIAWLLTRGIALIRKIKL